MRSPELLQSSTAADLGFRGLFIDCCPKRFFSGMGQLHPHPHQLRIAVIARHAAFDLIVPTCRIAFHIQFQFSGLAPKWATLVFRTIGWTLRRQPRIEGLCFADPTDHTDVTFSTHGHPPLCFYDATFTLGILTTCWIDVDDQDGRALGTWLCPRSAPRPRRFRWNIA